MSYDDNDAVTEVADDDVEPIEDTTSVRSPRVGAGYSPQARQRIEYLQELKRLRSQAGDDAIEQF
ncbi:MAG: hypothetical protein K9L70_13620 [Thiohalocapsa sp.]|nr:hypothetical protein [Thiohalocapsa sp.]MCF7990858.1 hypothetical protein [Thiohalocapsa sp.]